MTVEISRGRHRRPKHRFARAVATALLITLLISAPAITPGHRPSAFVTAQED